MRPCTLAEVARLSGGRLLQGAPTLPIGRLHTDTRSLAAGDCFVALQGARFDGHEFVAEIDRRGAVAALVSRGSLPPVSPALGLVEVSDTLVGLQRFAAAYRSLLPVRTIGVTGSSGKTSTKELIAAVLRTRYKTRATEGNLNNHIGVPLTLIALEEEDEFGVIEMGMNHPGEIAPLARWSAPEVGVISSIGPVHLEFFSDQAGIAEEKAELIGALPATGRAILNGGDEWSRRIARRATAPIVWTGEHPESQWQAREVRVAAEGIGFELHHGAESVAVRLPVLNRVMVENALLAAAVGGHFGLSLAEIARGLGEVKLPGARMQIVKLGGLTLIDDSYNANPASIRAALVALRDYPEPGRRLAVLGSMGELGEQAALFHREVGLAAAEAGIAHLIAVGPHAASYRQGARAGGLGEAQIGTAFDAREAEGQLQNVRAPGDVVLIKGSRFMALEKLIAALRKGEA